VFELYELLMWVWQDWVEGFIWVT